MFFDLVFVVAVAALGDLLRHNPSALGFVHFGVLFVPVWWAWVGYTFYADRFDTDDLVLRVTILAAMLAVAWLAVEVPRAFDNAGGGAGFAVAYALVRAILVGLYVRAHHADPRARPLTGRYIVGFTAGAALWLASALVTSPARYVLWGIAIVIELTPPLLSSVAFRSVPFHVSHIPERFSLFTIIALGETVVLVATGMAPGHVSTEAVLAAVCGFVIATCLWWVYFAFADSVTLASRRLAPQTYAYAHLLVFAGITATGAGALLAIRAAGAAFESGGRWALCGGATAFLLAIAAIQHVNVGRSRDPQVWGRIAIASSLVALGAAGRVLSAYVVTGLVAATLIVAVIAEEALADHAGAQNREPSLAKRSRQAPRPEPMAHSVTRPGTPPVH